MENIQNYIGIGFTVVGALVTAATVIVKLTPSQTDDNILAKIVKVLDWLSVVNPNKPKV
jgi:hypothetical protein